MQSKQPTQHSTKDDADRRQPPAGRTRKACQAPAWEVEEVLKKVALSCAKGGDMLCISGVS